MHYVYILYSVDYDKYYVGESADVARRLLYHNEKSDSSWTRSYRPWQLVRSIEVPDYSTARKVENYIKRKKSKQFIQRPTKEEDLVKWLIEQFVG